MFCLCENWCLLRGVVLNAGLSYVQVNTVYVQLMQLVSPTQNSVLTHDIWMINDGIFASQDFLLNWLSMKWYNTCFHLQLNILRCADILQWIDITYLCTILCITIDEGVWHQCYMLQCIRWLMLAVWWIEVYSLFPGQEVPCFLLLCCHSLPVICILHHFDPFRIHICCLCKICPVILPVMSASSERFSSNSFINTSHFPSLFRLPQIFTALNFEILYTHTHIHLGG
jgi:hypothetical protein